MSMSLSALLSRVRCSRLVISAYSAIPGVSVISLIDEAAISGPAMRTEAPSMRVPVT